MIRLIFQLIACAMLLCTASLKAAEQAPVSDADDVFEGSLKAETIDIILLHEQAPVAESVNAGRAVHGQPLPGLLLSVLVAGTVLKTLARIRRKAKHLQKLVAMIVSQNICKVVSLYHYFTTFESTYACCWEWQRTVLRL